MRTRDLVTLITLVTTLSLTLGSTPSAFAAGSGGGGGGLSTTYDNNRRALPPEELSKKAFRAGIKHRDRALKQEAKAASASSDKKRERALAKAQKEYKKAIKKQSEAMQLDPQNYKAANELGYAFRQTGEYEKAIGAYNYALNLNPNFHQATEYRAEAFLALGLLEHTQNAYMVLFRNDKELAQELMAKFDEWMTAKDGNMSPAEADFAAWVNERKNVARMSSELSMNNTRRWSSPKG